MWILRGRIAPAIAFFLLLSPPLLGSSRLRWVVLAAALVTNLIPLEMSRRYREFDRVMAGLPRVMEACPRDAQVLTVRPTTSRLRLPCSASSRPGADRPRMR